MRRASFLILTGLSVPAHRALVRGDLLPYAEDPAGGWSDYTVKQAFLTSLAIALAPMVGGQREAVRRVVDFPLPAWKEIRGTLLLDGMQPVYAASFETGLTTRAWAFGRLANLLNDKDLAELSPREVAVINLSAIARDIKQRAIAAGMPFAEDFSEAAIG